MAGTQKTLAGGAIRAGGGYTLGLKLTHILVQRVWNVAKPMSRKILHPALRTTGHDRVRGELSALLRASLEKA
jgi:hypothetical protein